jgi:transposase InsO family protein
MNDSSPKYQIIYEIMSAKDNVLNVKELCRVAGVSRSGYYAWLKAESKRRERDNQDQKDFALILEAYRHRGYDKGVRGIYMRLKHMGISMNQKKIRRLMRKYNLACPVRKQNPYRQMLRAMKTSAVAENLVNREFEKHGPRTILLTDITYIHLNDNFIYLSVIIDAYTKEVLSYVLSESLEVDFVLQTINLLSVCSLSQV